jgi:hypothetical protein
MKYVICPVCVGSSEEFRSACPSRVYAKGDRVYDGVLFRLCGDNGDSEAKRYCIAESFVIYRFVQNHTLKSPPIKASYLALRIVADLPAANSKPSVLEVMRHSTGAATARSMARATYDWSTPTTILFHQF